MNHASAGTRTVGPFVWAISPYSGNVFCSLLLASHMESGREGLYPLFGSPGEVTQDMKSFEAILELNSHLLDEGSVSHGMLCPTLLQPEHQSSSIPMTGWRSALQASFVFWTLWHFVALLLLETAVSTGSYALWSFVTTCPSHEWVHPMPVLWCQIRCCAASPHQKALPSDLQLQTPEIVQGKRQLLGQQRSELLEKLVLGTIKRHL